MKRTFERPIKIYAELNKLYCDFILDGIKNNITKAINKIYSYNGNNGDIKLCLLRAIFNLELNKIENGEFWLFSVDKYRKFIKLNDKTAYRLYLFACALANIKSDRMINAVKYIEKMITEHNQGDKYCGVMVAYLYSIMNISETEGFILIMSCYRRGNRSRFLYAMLYKYYFENKIKTSNLLNSFVKWAVLHNINIKFLIEEYKNDIVIRLTDYNSEVVKLYEKYPYDFLLNQLVKYFVNNFDYSECAYNIYKKALDKGLLNKEYYEAYLISAIKNEKNISDEICDFFIKSPIEDKECMAYVYSEAIKRGYANEEIIKFAIICLIDKEFDNYDMYAFLYMNGKKFGVAEDFIKKARGKVAEKIFEYKISYNKRAKEVKYIGIKKYLKENIEIANVEDGVCFFKNINNNFSVGLLDENQRMITGINFKAKGLISYISFDLVYSLYCDGYKSDEVFLYLADFIIANNIYDEKYIPILQEILNLKTTKTLKCKVAYVLFYIFTLKGNYEEAEKFIKFFDIFDMDKKALEYIAEKSIVMKNCELIFDIFRRYEIISINILKKMLNVAKNTEPLKTADYVYKFIEKDIYAEDFLPILFEYYDGDANKWRRIIEIISKNIKENYDVLLKIIEKCIKFSIFSDYFEKSFAFCYKQDANSEIIKKSIDFICEIAINKENNFDIKTISILEEYFEKTRDYILGFALGHIYIRQAVKTLKSREISKEITRICENTGISFPLFYNCKNDIFLTPFIIKNKPFLYKGKKGLRVYVYIQINDDKKIIKKEMTYFKYGIYISLFPVFSGEDIRYYFEEERADGSIITQAVKDAYPKANKIILDSEDIFFSINNSINRIENGEYRTVETILENLVFTDKNSDFILL